MGVDTLNVRVSNNRAPSKWLFEQFQTWRDHRSVWNELEYKDRKPLLVELPGVGTFQVQTVKEHYEFVLINDEICDIHIWNLDKWNSAREGQTGQFRFSFRSRLLQFNGPHFACDLMRSIVNFFCGDGLELPFKEFERVSRIDLCVDTELPKALNTTDILERYTCLARKRDLFNDTLTDDLENHLQKAIEQGPPKRSRVQEGRGILAPLLNNKGGDNYIQKLAKARGTRPEVLIEVMQIVADVLETLNTAQCSRIVAGGRNLQTAYFGRFGSQMFACVYDKLASLRVQDKQYMREVWKANGWDGERPVWRTEFRISGEFLQDAAISESRRDERDLRDLDVTLVAIPGLWAYLTNSWLKHCKPSEDKNVSRWESSAYWNVVQGAFPQMEPIVRVQPEPRPDKKQLMSQFDGLAKTIAAITSSPRYQRGLDLETGEVFDPIQSLLEHLAVMLHSDEALLEIEERRNRFGLDALSDSVFDSQWRAQRMLEGRGS
jgi:hypothetical protein